MVFEVGIGTSQSWDPKEAAGEAVTQASQSLTQKPTFILVFCTIHYEKDKGFNQILERVYHDFSEQTPLIGGTVTGFINKQGCFTRGVTVALFFSDEIDFIFGIGKNTKRSPLKAARECVAGIKKFNFRFRNKFLLLFSSGPSYPIVPGVGKIKVVKNPLFGLLLPIFVKFSTIFLQKGLGREQEIAEEIRQELPGFDVFGGSTNDDNNYTRNYQFFFDKVKLNCVLGLGISTNLKVDITGADGMIGRGIKGKIKKTSMWGYMIHDFDGINAQKKYLAANGWDESILDNFIHRKTIYYPIGIYFPDGVLHPYPVPIFTGREIILGDSARGNTYEFLTTSGKSLVDSADQSLKYADNSLFLFGVACAVSLEALGRNVYKIREKILPKTKDFLLIYMVGETRGKAGQYVHQFQETINFLSLKRQ